MGLDKKQKEQKAQVKAAEMALDELSSIIATGVNFRGRILYLVGSVGTKMMRKFLAGFHYLDSTVGEIKVVLNTYGGDGNDGNDGLAAYDAIRLAHNPVIVVGTGKVMSAGSVILQAGAHRVLTPSAEFMIHDGWLCAAAEVSKMRAILGSAESIDKVYNKILAERSGNTVEQIEKWSRAETYMLADEAVAKGFADEVAKVAGSQDGVVQ